MNVSGIGRTSRICLRCQVGTVESKRGDYCADCLRLLRRPAFRLRAPLMPWESDMYAVIDRKRVRWTP